VLPTDGEVDERAPYSLVGLSAMRMIPDPAKIIATAEALWAARPCMACALIPVGTVLRDPGLVVLRARFAQSIIAEPLGEVDHARSRSGPEVLLRVS
jgi:hypothetical protein